MTETPTTNKRYQLLKEIDEVSFAVTDMILYMDTHPRDEEGAVYFDQLMQKRKELLKQYVEEFEPLTADCICTRTNNSSQSFTKYPDMKHWTWDDGPLPWDIQCGTDSRKEAF